MLKYKCLVLDHDDTVVKSTPEINFPSFQKSLQRLRPGLELSLEEFIAYSFDPGFQALCEKILGFSKKEMELQLQQWKEDTEKNIPKFYEGMEEILHEQRDAGGLICVVSHSCKEIIGRDYRQNCELLPDMIFGWEAPEEQRKPNPYPLREILRCYHLSPKDLLVVDDLKPGLDMAKSCGVDFAWAGWFQQSQKIEDYMRKNSQYSFQKIKELRNFLFKI